MILSCPSCFFNGFPQRSWTPPGVLSQIEGRIHGVHILLVQLLPEELDRLAESLEVNHLPLPEELDHVIHIRVVRQPENVVVGNPGLLLWYVGLFTTIFSSLFENK